MSGHNYAYVNGQWVEAVPLPWFTIYGVRCGECRERFIGKRATIMPRYEAHWRQEHGRYAAI